MKCPTPRTGEFQEEAVELALGQIGLRPFLRGI